MAFFVPFQLSLGVFSEHQQKLFSGLGRSGACACLLRRGY